MSGAVLYGDECQNIISNPTKISQYEKILNNLVAEYRIFLSATPKRMDGMTKAMFALCGKIEHIISKEDVKDKTIKAVIKPIRTSFVIPKEATRWDGVINYSVLPTFIATDEARNNIIIDLLKKEKDNYCLVLSDRLEGLEYLHSQVGGLFINGKMTSKKAKEERQQAIEKMRNKEEHYLYASFRVSSRADLT